MNNSLQINPKKEVDKICRFILTTFQKQHISKVVIGLSGGIDSAVILSLLAKSLPLKNIYPIHLPYFKTKTTVINSLVKSLKIPTANFVTISIKKPVNNIKSSLNVQLLNSDNNKTRLGNIMARVRMIVLFDQAKNLNALVCGTENKSEHLLGYFTRFGDGASDIEPIQFLYKTQIYQLAKYLKLPQEIINQSPTAELWKEQTDEGQFGFTYQEADQVLSLFYDQNKSLDKIIKSGYINAKKIIKMVKNNQFKHQTPYKI